MAYKISIGSGLIHLHEFVVEADHEKEALDILIDRKEKAGNEGLFIGDEYIYNESDCGYYDADGELWFSEDMYITGGNHGRALKDYGHFNIQKIEEVA